MKISDLLILANALWETVDQKAKVREVVENHALDKVTKTLMEIERSVVDILANVSASTAGGDALEALNKIKSLVAEIDDLNADNLKTPDHQPEIDRVSAILTKAKEQVAVKMLA